MKKHKLYLLYFLFAWSSLITAKGQDIDGVWTGTFIQYVHNMYDIKLTVKKLPPGNIFNAQLSITDGVYNGEFNISGFICDARFLEISTIVLIKESSSSNWIDCLNGTFDLSDDANQLTFTDTWIQQYVKNNKCKLKYLQKDMFQCLRSVFFKKIKYQSELAMFNKNWEKAEKSKFSYRKPEPPKETQAIVQTQEPNIKAADDNSNTETKIVAKNEDRAPIIETIQDMKDRKVIVKDEIEVINKEITIEYWDRYTEDGDSVNIFLNGVPIVQNALLTKVKKIITVKLDKPINYLVLEAINLGTEPPNTASVTVKDGKKIQTISLTSTLQNSAALKIYLKD